MSMIQIAAIAGVVVLLLLLLKMRQDRQKAGPAERREGGSPRRGRRRRDRRSRAEEAMPFAAASTETAATSVRMPPPAPTSDVPLSPDEVPTDGLHPPQPVTEHAVETPVDHPEERVSAPAADVPAAPPKAQGAPSHGALGEMSDSSADDSFAAMPEAPAPPVHEPFAGAEEATTRDLELVTDPGWPMPTDLEMPFTDQGGAEAAPADGTTTPVADTDDGWLTAEAGTAGGGAHTEEWGAPAEVPLLGAEDSEAESRWPTPEASVGVPSAGANWTESSEAAATEPDMTRLGRDERKPVDVTAEEPSAAQADEWDAPAEVPPLGAEATLEDPSVASVEEWEAPEVPPRGAETGPAETVAARAAKLGATADVPPLGAEAPEVESGWPVAEASELPPPAPSAPVSAPAAGGRWDAVEAVGVAPEPDDEARRGRFALGGFAQGSAHETLTAVAFRHSLPAAPHAGAIELSVEGSINCDPNSATVIADEGFAPSREGFTVAVRATAPGPFMVSGTFRVR